MNILNTKHWIIALICCTAGFAQAKTVYVDQTCQRPTAPYTNATTAARTIQQAIDVTEDGDEVIIYRGIYTPSETLEVTNNIVLRGAFLSLEYADHSIINGENLNNVLDLGTNACQVVGLTIKDGASTGIYCDDNTPFVWNCIISGNQGNGMYKGSANGCIFTNNAGTYGGGARSTEAEYCLFVDNSATYGGGMQDGSAYRCTFRNNTATYGAGLKGGTARACTFINNIATTHGGGAYQSTLNQCVVTANQGGAQGGGMYKGTANNCTFFDNMASQGGGMYGGTANNSILWNNRAVHQENNIESQTKARYSCFPEAQTDDGNHNITNNPQLVSFSHIAATSPCIGAGSASYLTHLTDIDGEAWNATPSIGCDEIKTTVGGEMTLTLSTPELAAANQEIHFEAYVEGPVTQTVLDFGDGTAVTNPTSTEISHTFGHGNFQVVLTGYNDDYPGGVSVSNVVYSHTDNMTTVYVSEDGQSPFDGESWETAMHTIQEAVDAQDVAGGLVLVSNGTYAITSEICVEKEIRIEGLNGTENTTVTADGNHTRCFMLYNSHCTLKGLTLRDGRGYSPLATGGGAVYCSGLNPVVDSCTLTANNSVNGGGAMWRGTATNCTFRLNTGSNGPAGMQAGYAVDSLFEHNTSANGAGGIQDGYAARCIFKENKGTYGGGARDSHVFDCQFLFNEGIPNYRGDTSPGGGMWSGTAENCVFRGNKTFKQGGGTYNVNATHCTYTDNHAVGTGGGSYGGTLDHCIVWFNTALNGNDNIYGSTATDSCSPDLEHGVDGNITNNPQLVSASHIELSSPCAGSGTIPRDTLDIDGEHWRTNPAMGCDEPMLPYVASEVSITVDGPSDIPAGFQAFFTVDIQGAFFSDYVEFGNGQTAINTAIRPISHTWTTPGTYNMVVSAYDEHRQILNAVTNSITVRATDFNTLYVSTNGNDSADGRSWAASKQTIQAAIDAQEFIGGKVIISNGVYELTETLLIENEIQLIGLNGAEYTIIDGGSSNQYTGVGCLDIADNHTTVYGITFRNGNNQESTKGYSGGGVLCGYSLSPQIENCIFESNAATRGGAMAYGTAINCVFTNNWCLSGEGGGLYLGHAQGCTFIENSCRDEGGGMYGGIATACEFRDNTSGGYGGGMYSGTANSCTFENNTASQGGGMYQAVANDCRFIGNTGLNSAGGMYQGTANRCVFLGNQSMNHAGGMHQGIANSCVFSGNKAITAGGGLYYTTANHCTITANEAGTDGGGMYSGNANNCIVWFNTAAGDGSDMLSSSPHHTCSPDATHGENGCITNNPMLISSSHIAAASPCIGAGDPAYASGTDRDGEAWNTPPAMGCDEVGATLTGPIEMALYGPSPILVYTEGTYSVIVEGQVSKTVIDLGDGTMMTNSAGTFTHTWPGSISQNVEVILTGFNDTYPQGFSTTQIVEVVSTADSDIFVKTSGNDDNDGTSWASAKQTIQAGVDAQNIYKGRVQIGAGTYTVTEPILVDKPILLRGRAASTPTIVDGGGSTRCFNLGYSECVLEGLVIRNGAASTQGSGDNQGGGIYCENNTPRITYSTFENCAAYNGAGAYRGTLEYCTLTGNAATRGGASHESSLIDSTIVGNTADYGGGLNGSTATDCTLSNNTASAEGGAAYNSILTHSTISSNTAPSGGGLSSCDIDRCEVAHNRASVSQGGGMYKGTARNSIIRDNFAVEYGGGSSSATLRNCTVVENGADQGGGVNAGSVYNSIIYYNYCWTADINLRGASAKYCCSPGLTANAYNLNITNAPQFISHSPNIFVRGSDYYLANTSPCINAGNDTYVSTEGDYNNLPRIRYGNVDMGAFEMWLNGDSDSDGMDDSWELENFGGVTNAVAAENPDTDPHSNIQEFIAGTDPLDPLSYLKVTQTTRIDTETPGVTRITLEWSPSVAGRTYGVSWSTNLVDGFQDKGYTLPYPHDVIGFGNDLPNSYYKINVRLD
ncbi:choice-of-anchor Q domain-containing protein [Pontiellaceae bacterium B12227]|nr:choice-of-anchor Q domain-containing protein [Pontiellaceae bacterium B12227]